MRSKYLGVYNNKYEPINAVYKYRVSIKRFVNSKAEYTNVGYFKQELAAAYVYNIYALAIFGKGAVINDIQPNAKIEEEVMAYSETRPDFLKMMEDAAFILEVHNKTIKRHVVRDSGKPTSREEDPSTVLRQE